MKLLFKPIPAIYLFAFLVLSTGIIFYQYSHPKIVVEKIEGSKPYDIQFIRNSDYKFIRPLVLADHVFEDPIYTNLRSSLNELINQKRAEGKLTSASIYVRDFDGGKWFAINPDEKYSPGSMMKIMTLITYLKESENNPDLLNNRVQFKAHFSEVPQQQIITNQLVSGRYYTVKELLETMIIDSNNDATVLLNSTVNNDTYFKILKLIDLQKPDIKAADYPLTSVEMSKLLRILFNSSVMSPANSEYAMSLLTKSKFHDGITRPIPDGINVAHKFGERFTINEQQLHETGIIYCQNKPYLLTVMTKGSNQVQLEEVLSGISKEVWDFMSRR